MIHVIFISLIIKSYFKCNKTVEESFFFAVFYQRDFFVSYAFTYVVIITHARLTPSGNFMNEFYRDVKDPYVKDAIAILLLSATTSSSVSMEGGFRVPALTL